MELKNHVKQNMIHVEELMLYDNETIKEFFKTDCYYTLDTESCDDNVTAWVYAWSIGNTENDLQIYGEDLNDVYMVFDKIARAHNIKYNSKKGTSEKFKVFVHNLTWDFEFFKYSLFEMGFEMFFGSVKYGNKVGVLEPGTFSIMENDGSIYMANIKLHDGMTFVSNRKNKNGEYKTQTVNIEIELIDSAKIMQKKLKEIADEVIEIDDMFKKLDDDYDYETIRNKGHKLTMDEKCYLYNDVYILKEFVRQFYIPLGTTKTTASSIAFEKFLEHTFKQKSSKENYSVFSSVYPDLTGFVKITDIIKKSYRGGWTQANRKYINNIVKTNNAVSIDINSSYPAVVKSKMLPFGSPVRFSEYDVDFIRQKGYDMEILTIAFDGFANNNSDDLIGHIKVGGHNVYDYNEFFATDRYSIKGSEYIHTNIVGGIKKGDTIKDYCLIGCDNPNEKRRFTLNIWSFELENLLQYMSFYIEDKKWDRDVEDWVSLDKLKKGFEIVDVLAFKGAVGMFADAVEYYTAEKIAGKETNNACKTEMAKLMLNSFYGKMGSNPVRIDRSLKMNENGQIKYNGAVHSYKTSKRYYMAFASAVTAWARVNLRTTLYKVGYNNVLYFDTDSLYTTITKDELVERCGDILDDFELGKWKVEKHYNSFKTIGAKKYILTDTDENIICKCAGLPDDVRSQITYEQFEIGAEFTGKKSKQAIKGGYVLRDKPFKILDEKY